MNSYTKKLPFQQKCNHGISGSNIFPNFFIYDSFFSVFTLTFLILAAFLKKQNAGFAAKAAINK